MTSQANIRPPFDSALQSLADYIVDTPINSQSAFETAKYCLIDSIGCAILALSYPACTKLLGPVVSGMSIEQGARVLGTSFELDPLKAAFDTGTLIRWLDYNDTWLAAEWGHPSDNLGALLAVMDFMARRPHEYPQAKVSIKDLLDAMIRAYEIQGILALENSFNQVGLDHVVLVKVASCGVATKLLGGNKEQILAALSQAWIDGQSLRTYRHAPNTGSRKSWAAGDASSRGLRLAMMTLQGEMGYPSALTAKQWGFQDVLFKGKSLSFARKLESYCMENILFKIAYPAEFHAQTAVECALKLHEACKGRISEIEKIEISTHQAAMRIINKTGPLHNPADRDHCLQYMVACALIDGTLTADSYEEKRASDSQIDQVRDKMQVSENPQYSKDYLDADKRSIANRLEITFNDGSIITEECEYPLGHKRRRSEGIPLLWEKCEKNLLTHFDKAKTEQLIALFKNDAKLLDMKVSDLVSILVN